MCINSKDAFTCRFQQEASALLGCCELGRSHLDQIVEMVTVLAQLRFGLLPQYQFLVQLYSPLPDLSLERAVPHEDGAEDEGQDGKTTDQTNPEFPASRARMAAPGESSGC